MPLVLGPGHISFTDSNSRAKVCFFSTGFGVRVLSLVLGSELKSFTGSGFRARTGFFGWPFYPTVLP